MLLADHAVIGIFGADRRADERLDLAVAVGNHVLVALALDGQRIEGAEIGEAELAGAKCELRGKAHALVIVVGHDVSGQGQGMLLAEPQRELKA